MKDDVVKSMCYRTLIESRASHCHLITSQKASALFDHFLALPESGLLLHVCRKV